MTTHPPVRSSLFSRDIVVPAIAGSFRKLDPRQLIRNPVMFTTAVVAVLLTVLLILRQGAGSPLFQIQLVFWLWLTVLFGNFAEALAEGRGKAQAASLRDTKSTLVAKRISGAGRDEYLRIDATELRAGDLVLVETDDLIPADGEVVEGVASVNEAAITGESAPVIREAGGDRSAVTAGTRVISDRIKVRVTQEPGQGFLDRMIALIEGAERQKTPNEIALTILLVGLTIIFLIAVATIPSFAVYSGGFVPASLLAALLITLIPTTIAALLSAIGIAGMDRLVRFNVLAKSGRAVEAAGDIDVLLLDKTGTITIGDRHATEFKPLAGVSEVELAEAAYLASLADETPEGRSIVDLARERYRVEAREMPADAEVIPFTAQTRLSGIRIGDRLIQKGAVDSILRAIPGTGESAAAAELPRFTDEVARAGGTPLAVSEDGRLLGILHLKDIIKAGMRERFLELRRMGIRTVMITGDNPLTAASIAAEAGVDDFLAEATPEDKLDLSLGIDRPDAMLLDLGLPDRDGLELVPLIKKAGAALVVVSAREATEQKVAALDLGADDYVTKPFDTEELLARVRVALRHRLWAESEIDVLRVGDVTVDLTRRVVTKAGAEVHLTPKEYGFLAELAGHPGRVMTHAQLLRAVWGPAHEHDVEYLRVTARGVRKKLESDPGRPNLIRNEPGVGYRLVS